MGCARAVAVDDRRQPLNVGSEHVGNSCLLCLAEFRELLRHMGYRAMMLTDLDALDRSADPGRRGGVAGLGQRVSDVFRRRLDCAVIVGLGGGPLAVIGAALVFGGFVIEYAAWTVGLGGALITRFGRRGDVPAVAPPAPATMVDPSPEDAAVV